MFLREKDDFVFIASLYFEWYSVEESFDLFLYSAGKDLSLLYPSLCCLLKCEQNISGKHREKGKKDVAVGKSILTHALKPTVFNLICIRTGTINSEIIAHFKFNIL